MSELRLHSDHLADLRERPSIIDVVSRYVTLRRSGREHIGLCPFHPEKTPSFTVNEYKGVFYCHGCGEGDDVIAFVQKVEGVGFLEALSILDMRQDQIPRARNDAIRRRAETVTQWANDCFDKTQSLLRQISQRARIAGKLHWREEVGRCVREWEILSVLSDDLQDPTQVMSLWAERESVEAILAGAVEEPLPDYPPIAPEHRERLRLAVRGEL